MAHSAVAVASFPGVVSVRKEYMNPTCRPPDTSSHLISSHLIAGLLRSPAALARAPLDRRAPAWKVCSSLSGPLRPSGQILYLTFIPVTLERTKYLPGPELLERLLPEETADPRTLSPQSIFFPFPKMFLFYLICGTKNASLRSAQKRKPAFKVPVFHQTSAFSYLSNFLLWIPPVSPATGRRAVLSMGHGRNQNRRASKERSKLYPHTRKSFPVTGDVRTRRATE